MAPGPACQCQTPFNWPHRLPACAHVTLWMVTTYRRDHRPMCGTSSRAYPLLQSIDESKLSSSLCSPRLCFAIHLCSLLSLCSSLHHANEKPSMHLPQATGHRVAHATPSSLSEAILKPQLQVSSKRRSPFTPLSNECRRVEWPLRPFPEAAFAATTST
jgi:hypothetical protein